MVTDVREIFSHFKLSSFETCPKQYHFRYKAKIRIDLVGIEAFMGKQVHAILQELYLLAEDGEVPSLDQVLSHYRDNWRRRFDADRIQMVHADKEPDFYYGNGVRCIEHYYLRNYAFDREVTLGLEKRIRFQLDDNGKYRMNGVIDRLARASDGVLEIHDFKTGAQVPSQAVLDEDRQLGLYEIGVRQHFDDAGEIRLVWHYVYSDQVRTSVRTPQQLADLRATTIGLIDRICRETEWSPSRGPLCDWCEYKEICPAFGNEEDPLRLL